MEQSRDTHLSLWDRCVIKVLNANNLVFDFQLNYLLNIIEYDKGQSSFK